MRHFCASLPRILLAAIAYGLGLALGLAAMSTLSPASPSMAQMQPVPMPVVDNSPATGANTMSDGKRRDIVVVFDRSVSVVGDYAPRSVLSDSVTYLDLVCPSSCRFGAIAFGSKATVAVPLKFPRAWTPDDITQIVNNTRTTVGEGTNFSETLRVAVDLLGGPDRDRAIDGRIVLVTDAEFDKEDKNLEAQKTASWRWIGEVMVPAGIRLIVIDVNESDDNDSKMWKKHAENTPGGRYLTANAYGSYVDTLKQAIIEQFSDVIQVAGIPQIRGLHVPAYQKQLSVYYQKTEDITVSLEPPKPTSPAPMAKQVSNNAYVYLVNLPMEGTWVLRVEGTGEVVYWFSTEPRELGLHLEEYTGRLEQGAPLWVWFSVRDLAPGSAPITDPHFQFTGRLVQVADGRSIRAVRIKPASGDPRYADYYEASFVNTQNLLGDFSFKVTASVPGLPMPISGAWPVFFGRSPQFASAPKLSTSDLRIGQAFSITVSLVNLEVLDHPPHIQLEVNGENDSRLAIREMTCAQSICCADIPAVTVPGVYTFTAVLYGGATKEGVSYDSKVSASSVVRIRALYPWEWIGQHIWELFLVALLVTLILVPLVMIYRRTRHVLRAFTGAPLSDPERRRVIYKNVRRKARSGRKHRR